MVIRVDSSLTAFADLSNRFAMLVAPSDGSRWRVRMIVVLVVRSESAVEDVGLVVVDHSAVEAGSAYPLC